MASPAPTPDDRAACRPGAGGSPLLGRCAIVTGASRGIGRALALGFARAGADVVANFAPDQPEPLDLIAEIAATGRSAVAVQADVGRLEEHARLVDAAMTRFGRIDILVNNAAIKGKAPFLDVAEANWDELMGVNLKGPYFLAQRVARAMIAAGTRGRIINVTSNHESKPLRGSSLYSISKSDLGMLTQVLALELTPHGITVNRLIPGSFATMMNRDALENPVRRAEVGKFIPLGRMGEPEDLVAAAVFLAGPGADYITGSGIRVDGGLGLM